MACGPELDLASCGKRNASPVGMDAARTAPRSRCSNRTGGVRGPSRSRRRRACRAARGREPRRQSSPVELRLRSDAHVVIADLVGHEPPAGPDVNRPRTFRNGSEKVRMIVPPANGTAHDSTPLASGRGPRRRCVVGYAECRRSEAPIGCLSFSVEFAGGDLGRSPPHGWRSND